MKVTLLSYTPNAIDLLLFTKSTRLNMTPGLMDDIKTMEPKLKIKELKYIADTIPSSWEFIDYIFLVEGVSRAYTHQQVRTRVASFAQQSMRVTDMGDFDYIFTDKNQSDPGAMRQIKTCIRVIQSTYKCLIDNGQSIEDARGVLPTNISTNIVCKFNLRTFSELVKSRTGGRTQKEYQNVVKAMVDEVLKVHSWVEMFLFKEDRNHFNDIEAFAEKHFGGDLKTKGELLKIVDKMRKGE